MKNITIFCACWLFFAHTCQAQNPSNQEKITPAEIISVWPEGKMPGKGATAPEAEKPSKDAFHRITNVSTPTLSLFRVQKQESPAPVVIVCPGGGYNYVVIDKEGTQVANWLNSQGINAMVLKYRNPSNRQGALQDLQRAISLVRSQAQTWHIDTKRVGVMGFSAGGHLAACASTQFDDRSYATVDTIDNQSCRPDFTVLVYPAYLGSNGKVASELKIEANIPPTFIVHVEDDSLCITGSKLYVAALKEAQKEHESKLYPTGGHGFGLHSTKAAKAWPEDAVTWLHKIGVK